MAPCRYYNTSAGCRFGSQCTFSHQDPTSPGSPTANRGAPKHLTPRASPNGVCNTFWLTGECPFNFRCRFKHTYDPSKESQKSPSQRMPAASVITPFLTESGLAKVSRGSTDIYFQIADSLRPSEAQSHLNRFLYDNYRFRTPTDIYSFVKIICNASTENKSWTPDDGQLLLAVIATDNGLLRIGDILRFETVSIRAGSSRAELSFQRGLLPLLRYMSSDFVIKSTLSHLVNALFNAVLENFTHFAGTVRRCMTQAIEARSFSDPNNRGHPVFGTQVFASLATVLFQLLTRFKNVCTTQPLLPDIVRNVQGWMVTWVDALRASPVTFDDPFKDTPLAARQHITADITRKVESLVAIVDREEGKHRRISPRKGGLPLGVSSEGMAAALRMTYEGPGTDREDGPRHDNDFVDISDIRVAPTREELLCRIPPFLPASIHNAPHPHPSDSVQRLLDIQFRLLREELTAPLRTSVQLVEDDLCALPGGKTKLQDIISKKGGKYRGSAQGQESVMFNVYTGVVFKDLVPDHRGLTVSMSFDSPPGRARGAHAKSRASFWEGLGGKRLMQGGLIALVWKQYEDVSVHLGTLATSLRDIVDSARASDTSVTARVIFFDPTVEIRILQALKRKTAFHSDTILLIEAPVMFEAIRPFLEALKVEPESLPFGKHLVHRPPHFFGPNFKVDPPRYTVVPGFSFQLASLFPASANITDLKLVVGDPRSVENARHELRQGSRLDASQADAVVDALTRELSLIQGPPGTGKSFTSVELLRVLVENRITPILMIAFTNHALDHLLSSVLDAGITDRIVRLGSRSADERISQFSIETMERAQGESKLNRPFAHLHWELKGVEDQVKGFMKRFLSESVESGRITSHLEMVYPELFESLECLPSWIAAIKEITGDDGEGEWQQAGRAGKAAGAVDVSTYAFWRSGRDIEFLQQQTEPQPTKEPIRGRYEMLEVEEVQPDPDESDVDEGNTAEDRAPEEEWLNKPPPASSRQPDPPSTHKPVQITQASFPPAARPIPNQNFQALSVSDLADTPGFFAALGYSTCPRIQDSDREIDDLVELSDIWQTSYAERQRLHFFLTDEVRTKIHEDGLVEFEELRRKHGVALSKYNEKKDETRRQLLRNVDIIGCTTTGAAKLTALLKGLAPRVMLVEEAGQVLEAHVLGSLVPSIEHLMLVGDPLQLRPTLNNFSLSMDSRRGQELYKFDMSTMERLSSRGFPMSQIDVQRRMRPEISDLIRNHLYPALEDHDLVTTYPPVRGLAKNVFFFTHDHKEGGGADESASRYNGFEVEMIKDLVLYLLRQGCYSAEGDIVVLCAYLGQLGRVRDALASEVAVVIDERDQLLLADQQDRKEELQDPPEATVEHVQVSKRVRLRTVDNYQGEEAKIVILSLVRNSGGAEDEETNGRVNIGFLKSENRTNVALSRAKEGLFILGNAPNLCSRSRMWASVIEILEKRDCVGGAFPAVCSRHPDTIMQVSTPGKLPRMAPDGGCLRSCGFKLKCGHLCPYKCHPDDVNHISVVCSQPCRRLCARGHPCRKMCSDSCEECVHVVNNVELPCGHVVPEVYCHQLDALEDVRCNTPVVFRLPGCEHTAMLACSADSSQHNCSLPCNGTLRCCGRTCSAPCHSCQALNPVVGQPPKRVDHAAHPCQKSELYCEHRCANPCSTDHHCTTLCKEPCRQQCTHTHCTAYCSTPCAPCMQPCTWSCPHQLCPVPCGSVCSRLPCDLPCGHKLPCGHACPSVCGEDCSIQICPTCASPDTQAAVVDWIMQRTLKDIDPTTGTLDEMLITIPKCKHAFTVETLDGICSLNDYYTREGDQWIGLQAPQIGFKKPPVCPTCRAAITSPRYGRVYKRADLDILEKNVASRMAGLLNKVDEQLGSTTKEAMQATLSASTAAGRQSSASVTEKVLKLRSKSRSQVIRSNADLPSSVDTIDPAHHNYHGIHPKAKDAWLAAVHHLVKAYGQSLAVARTRSSHIEAWEAAFSYLHQQEMDRAVAHPERAPRHPEEHAMRVATLTIGQPKPLADKKYLVEAFWTTITIRFTLAALAMAWLPELCQAENYPAQDQRIWSTYIHFLLQSALKDAEKALVIATRSGSQRQMAQSTLLILRAKLELFRFNVDRTKATGNTTLEQRTNLADSASKKGSEANASLSETRNTYLRAMGSTAKEIAWLDENLTAGKAIIAEWAAMERSLRTDTFYQPVSLDEQRNIVRAFKHEFSHTGHFYNCRNGHAFVIGECGGAMEHARCPECGDIIGGSNHQLQEGNRQAEDLEAIMRQEGAQRSPWAWAR